MPVVKPTEPERKSKIPPKWVLIKNAQEEVLVSHDDGSYSWESDYEESGGKFQFMILQYISKSPPVPITEPETGCNVLIRYGTPAKYLGTDKEGPLGAMTTPNSYCIWEIQAFEGGMFSLKHPRGTLLSCENGALGLGDENINWDKLFTMEQYLKGSRTSRINTGSKIESPAVKPHSIPEPLVSYIGASTTRTSSKMLSVSDMPLVSKSPTHTTAGPKLEEHEKPAPVTQEYERKPSFALPFSKPIGAPSPMILPLNLNPFNNDTALTNQPFVGGAPAQPAQPIKRVDNFANASDNLGPPNPNFYGGPAASSTAVAHSRDTILRSRVMTEKSIVLYDPTEIMPSSSLPSSPAKFETSLAPQFQRQESTQNRVAGGQAENEKRSPAILSIASHAPRSSRPGGSIVGPSSATSSSSASSSPPLYAAQYSANNNRAPQIASVRNDPKGTSHFGIAASPAQLLPQNQNAGSKPGHGFPEFIGAFPYFGGAGPPMPPQMQQPPQSPAQRPMYAGFGGSGGGGGGGGPRGPVVGGAGQGGGGPPPGMMGGPPPGMMGGPPPGMMPMPPGMMGPPGGGNQSGLPPAHLNTPLTVRDMRGRFLGRTGESEFQFAEIDIKKDGSKAQYFNVYLVADEKPGAKTEVFDLHSGNKRNIVLQACDSELYLGVGLNGTDLKEHATVCDGSTWKFLRLPHNPLAFALLRPDSEKALAVDKSARLLVAQGPLKVSESSFLLHIAPSTQMALQLQNIEQPKWIMKASPYFSAIGAISGVATSAALVSNIMISLADRKAMQAATANASNQSGSGSGGTARAVLDEGGTDEGGADEGELEASGSAAYDEDDAALYPGLAELGDLARSIEEVGGITQSAWGGGGDAADTGWHGTGREQLPIVGEMDEGDEDAAAAHGSWEDDDGSDLGGVGAGWHHQMYDGDDGDDDDDGVG